MKLELKKHKYYLLVLTAMFFVLIYLFVPEGSVFGSNTDWMSQHAELAETLRDACLSQGTIFPDFLWLGGEATLMNSPTMGICARILWSDVFCRRFR